MDNDVVRKSYRDLTKAERQSIAAFKEAADAAYAEMEKMDYDVVRESYRDLTTIEQKNIAAIKEAGASFLELLDVGQSRELALARTKIEEAVMWAVKHVTADPAQRDLAEADHRLPPETLRTIFSLENFAAWLGSRTYAEPYNYGGTTTDAIGGPCPVCRYLTDVGYDFEKVVGAELFHADGSFRDISAFDAIVRPEPHTYGDALERAELALEAKG